MSAMTGLDQTRRTRLTPAREAELFGEIVDLLVEEGYDNLTMDTIASRTHTSKATLYRQWQGKPQLIAAAMRHVKGMGFGDIDTGSICGDLREMARRIGATGHRQTGVFWSLADSIRRNPELKAALHEALFEPAERQLRGMLQRASDRGEISSTTPSFDFVHCSMVGAVLSHSVTAEGEVDADYMIRFVDAVVLPSLGFHEPDVPPALDAAGNRSVIVRTPQRD